MEFFHINETKTHFFSRATVEQCLQNSKKIATFLILRTRNQTIPLILVHVNKGTISYHTKFCVIYDQRTYYLCVYKWTPNT